MFGLPIPPWLYAAAAGIALGGSFYTGWHVRAIRCENALLKAQAEAEKAFHDQLAHQNAEATEYEGERSVADQQASAREERIRTIYRGKPVDADCAADPASRSVLSQAVDDANARAAGSASSPLPEPSTAP